MVIKVPKDYKKILEKAGYRVYNHSAVEICHWTKKAIRENKFCYKNKFYGIETHRCMQMTPCVFWCLNRCIYCWRPHENYEHKFLNGLPKDEVDPPEILLEKLREYRKSLLIGFYGNPNVNKKLLEEALEPSHITFSLSGEPMLYPYIPEAIEYIKNNWSFVKSIFIVTSALCPSKIQDIIERDILPHQFYISFVAPEEKLYKKITRSLLPYAWNIFNRSLEIAKDMPTRKVARITLIKGINDDISFIPLWKDILYKYEPDFIEIKAFMLLGYSRKRLIINNMPSHEDVKNWSLKLLEAVGDKYFLESEDPSSRVVLLKHKKSKYDTKLIN